MFSTPEFWVAVGFAIFIALTAKPIGKLIVGALDERAAKIKAGLERATQLREEAQDLLAQYQRKHRDALKEAEAIVEHAKAEAERLSAQAQADLETALKRREQLALQHIAQEEARALAEVRAAAVDLAVQVAGRLIAERIDAARSDALIDDAIKQLPGKLN